MSKQPYILIVEDDDWLAQQYVRTLIAAKMNARVVGHALAAIDAIDEKTPDVLVLDVLLPGPNIFTLLHEVRSHSDLASIPVILCTNSAEHLINEDMAAYGVRTILDKATMMPGDMIAAIKKILP